MNKTQEALKLALEALRDYRRSDDDRVSVAIGILQKALAEQPAQQQEPVAWMYDWISDGQEGGTVVRDWISADYDEAHSPTNGCHNIRPLYTSPPASKPWVGLSYEEVKELIEFEDYENDPQGFIEFVEAKLRDKNA